MEKRAPHISGKGSTMAHGKSSLFDIPAKLDPVGSSLISLAVAPNLDMDYVTKPKVEYENTYRMDPLDRFLPERVKPVIYELLSKHLSNMEYEPIQCSSVAKVIAQELKVRVREMNFHRFKIISLVSVGEKRSQDVRQGSRCLWDAETDNFASTCYENPHIFATATVYAVYFE
ncbi:outer arm dynein light chain 1 [Apostichopus japonicus]|uniref:Outer arm dynein light chain 1 n=2 Tax=Stichopus japonicus TaxID=307972 RepID=A0A2G8KUN3_STIJA|nr:outer arm dynein light chain 1 [Apostichopus japonicus]